MTKSLEIYNELFRSDCKISFENLISTFSETRTSLLFGVDQDSNDAHDAYEGSVLVDKASHAKSGH